jgi:hypothetical protein
VKDTESGPVGWNFAIDQRTNRGTWVFGGTHPVTGDRLVVQLVNRGQDWNSAGRPMSTSPSVNSAWYASSAGVRKERS